MRRLLLFLFLLGAVAAAQAGAVAASVNDARMRWLPGDLPLAGYFSITNQGSFPLYLVGASSPAFGDVMLHRSVEKDGMQRMVHVDRLDLAPGQTLVFAPGGYHLMLMDRKHPLHPGDKVPVTLRFSDGQTLEVPFRVEGTRGE